jgi:hypothetical protein
MQVIEERQVLGVCVANPGMDLCAGRRRLNALDPGGRAQQPGYDPERNVGRVRFAEGGEDLHVAATSYRGNLAHQTAFADAG